MDTRNNLPILIRIFSYSILAITFVFLFNNVLTVWLDWPGIKQLYSHYGIFGFKKLSKPLEESVITDAFIQLFFYFISIAVVIFYVLKSINQSLETDSKILTKFTAYIIRSSFWAVLIVGMADFIVSFMAVERLIDPIFNEAITVSYTHLTLPTILLV